MVQSLYRRKESVCTWIKCSSSRSSNDNIKEEEKNRTFFSFLSLDLSLSISSSIVEHSLFCPRNVWDSMYSSRSYMPCRCVMAIAYSFSLAGQCLLRARATLLLNNLLCVLFLRSFFFSFFLSFFLFFVLFSASFLFSFSLHFLLFAS